MTTRPGTRTKRGGIPMRPRLTAMPVVLAGIALLTSACSTQSGSAAPQATVTVTAVPAHAVTADPSSPPASAAPVDPASSSPASPASPAASPAKAQAAPALASCSTRYLGGSAGVSQGAAGSTYVVLVFKNLNNYACTLYGYPGVAMDAGVPVTPVGLAAAEDPTTPRELVTLAPYGTASALLRIMTTGVYSPAACHPVNTQFLQIIPPGQTVPIYVGYTAQTCAKPIQILTVDAVRPGSGSS